MEYGDDSRQVTRRATLFVAALQGEWLDIVLDESLDTPSVVEQTLHLPPYGLSQNSTARASALHAYAHRIFGNNQGFNSGNYKTRQIKLIELIEDARVEALLLNEFPGLRALFTKEIVATSVSGNSYDRLALELMLALLQPQKKYQNPWVQKGVNLFHANFDRWHDCSISIEIGLKLAHDIGQMRIPMNEKAGGQLVGYRDDNQHLWVHEEVLTSGNEEESEHIQLESQSFLVEADQGRQLSLADRKQAGNKDALYINTEKNPSLSYRAGSENENESELFYPEWHYQLERFRDQWCRVGFGELVDRDSDHLEEKLAERIHILRQLKRVARNMRLERMERQRKVKDGDELDFNAALDAYVGMQIGEESSQRIYTRSRPVHDGGLATKILLDMSESTARKVYRDETVLGLAKQAALMLVSVIEELYESVAIDGFCSNTRNQVEIFPVRNFSDNDRDQLMSRLAGLDSHWSTRLGAAIRHSTASLVDRDDYHRLLLVLSDGEPSDIDVFDSQYLVEDARMAVQQAKRQGVMVFGVLLNQDAGQSARRIFGERYLMQLTDLSQLPEQLAKMFLRIIRHY